MPALAVFVFGKFCLSMREEFVEFSKKIAFLVFETKLFERLFLEWIICEADFDDKREVFVRQVPLGDLAVDQVRVDEALVQHVDQLDQEGSGAVIVGKIYLFKHM